MRFTHNSAQAGWAKFIWLTTHGSIAAYQEAMKYDLDSLRDQIHLGAAYAKAGAREQAETILKPVKMSGEYVSPVELMMFYVASGEREKAFSSLERVSDAHDLQLQYLGVEPSFDPLRADPRFQDLLRRVGLPQ